MDDRPRYPIAHAGDDRVERPPRLAGVSRTKIVVVALVVAALVVMIVLHVAGVVPH